MTKRENKLEKQTILVTGVSSGIGEALVKRLISDGNKVIGLARRKDKLDAMNEKLPKNTLFPFLCDVTNENSLQIIREELVSKNLVPQCIVLCAAQFKPDIDPDYNHTIVKETMDVNFMGCMNVVNTFLPLWKLRGNGHFIVISSIAAFKPSLRGISYSASKAAVAMAFRGLNLTHKKNGLAFSTIYLGPVRTEMWEGKTSWLVTKPEVIAKKISRLILHPKSVTYMPFISTTLSRLTTLIPDQWYARLSRYLLK